MISPDITGNPAPIDKDAMSGTGEKADSVPFLPSLLSLISSPNPVNTIEAQDEIVNSWQKTEDRLAEDRRQTLASECLSSVFCIERIISLISSQGETTFSEKPGSLSLNSYSSANDKPVGKSCDSTDIQTPISMIKKEIVEFSSLNIAQHYHSEEKESTYTPAETTGILPAEFPARDAEVTNPSSLHQFTPSPVRISAPMEKDLASHPFKDMSISGQEVKGPNVDDKTVLSLDGDRESVIEEVNRDLTGSNVSKKNGETVLLDPLKAFKDGFEDEFKITMVEVSTDHRNKNGAHQQEDVPDSSAPRQLDLPSNIVSSDNTKPPQDKQSLEFSKAMTAHLDMEHSHDPDLSTIKVTVQHDRLGELDIKLVLNKGVINGQIKTPEVTTADLIVRNIPEIINSLIKDGLNVGNLFVSLRNSRSGRDNFDYGNSGDSGEISRRQAGNLCPIPSGQGYIDIFV